MLTDSPFTVSVPGSWEPWQNVGTCGDSNCGLEKQKRVRSCDDLRLVKDRSLEYQGTCSGPTHDCVKGCPSKKDIFLYQNIFFNLAR